MEMGRLGWVGCLVFLDSWFEFGFYFVGDFEQNVILISQPLLDLNNVA